MKPCHHWQLDLQAHLQMGTVVSTVLNPREFLSQKAIPPYSKYLIYSLDKAQCKLHCSLYQCNGNSCNLTAQHLNKLKALPCPFVAFSQAFLLNSFRWPILGKLEGNCFTISLGTTWPETQKNSLAVTKLTMLMATFAKNTSKALAFLHEKSHDQDATGHFRSCLFSDSDICTLWSSLFFEIQVLELNYSCFIIIPSWFWNTTVPATISPGPRTPFSSI